MKKIKGWKLAAFALMFVLVLAGTVKLIASAADDEKGFNESQIEVDYVNETITVTVVEREGENGYPTVDLKDLDTIVYYTDKYNKDLTKWESCEVREIEYEVEDENGKTTTEKRAVAVFDISWVNDSKTVRLYLCGNKEYKKVVAVDLTWEENFKVDFTGTLLATDITQAEEWQAKYKEYPNFTEDTGYFIFTLEEDGRDNYYMDLENILWRKGDDGVWREFKELDLKEMNMRGIKLEFRIAASNDTDAPARASSTAKFNVSKLSSAPQVEVNPDTMSIMIKNGMEFSFTWGPEKDDWIMVPEYSKKFGEYEKFVTLEERDTAYEEIYTDERVSELNIQQVLAAYLNENGVDFKMNSKMDYTTLSSYKKDSSSLFTFTEDNSGIILYVRKIGSEKDAASKIAEVIIPCAADGMAEAVKDDLKISYGESKTNTGGIVVENVSNKKYQVAVLDPEHPDYAKVLAGERDNIDISELKWTSIKAGKTMKLANKKAPKGSFLLYRIAGEEGNLPSTYVFSEELKYDALTYAGIDSTKKTVGDELTAVTSTNLMGDTSLTYQWQECADPKADPAEWTAISGATSEKYTLADAQVGKYIRVVITKGETSMESDYIGPVKAGKKTEEEEKQQ